MMDYLSTLLSLDGVAIADYEGAFERGPVRLNSSDRRLFAALADEVDTAATLVAVSASVANAILEFGSKRVNPRGLATFAPPDLDLYAPASARLMSGDFDAALAATLRSFQTRLALAKRMSHAFAAEAAENRPAPSIDPEVLAHAWTRTCSAAESLRGALAALDLRDAPSNATSLGIANLLNAAARGAHPCVEPDGVVVIPGWAERRRHHRIKTDIEIEVHAGARVIAARVFDISQGGAGLTDAGDMKRGDAVSLKLASGRKLRGTVAWTSGGKTGVRFTEPLAQGDPILSPPAR